LRKWLVSTLRQGCSLYDAGIADSCSAVLEKVVFPEAELASIVPSVTMLSINCAGIEFRSVDFEAANYPVGAALLKSHLAVILNTRGTIDKRYFDGGSSVV